MIKVCLLGEISLCLGEVEVNERASRSDKVWLILAYLLYHHGRMVPREELLRLLDTGDADSDRVRMLQNIRSSVRRVIRPLSEAAGKELILTGQGAFGWNPDAPPELDTERFTALLDGAEEAEDPAVRAGMQREAVRLFRGPFLERLRGDFWASGLSGWYDERCLAAADAAAAYVLAQGDAETAVELCHTALRLDPYRESAYRVYMRALAAQGNYAAADAVYRGLRDRLLSELGLMPQEETQEAHQEIVRALAAGALSLQEIRQRLRETETPTGAMLCDIATFRLIYQSESRSAPRRGDAIHLAVLSVVGKDGQPLRDTVLSRAMRGLRGLLQSTLRVGDVAACCSASQYVVLLVQANIEDSVMVCSRLSRAFARAYPHSQAEIRAVCAPLAEETVNS